MRNLFRPFAFCDQRGGLSFGYKDYCVVYTTAPQYVRYSWPDDAA